MSYHFFHSHNVVSVPARRNIATLLVVLLAVIQPFGLLYAEEIESIAETVPSEATGAVEETPEAVEEISVAEPVTITTGDADAELVLESSENISETDTNPEPAQEDSAPAVANDEPMLGDIEETEIEINELAENSDTENAALLSDAATDEENATTTAGSITLDVENNNNATTTNDALIEAETGENTGSGGSGSSISTGNAIATADILNISNLNIINSSGFFLLFNNMLGSIGSLDFRDIFSLPAAPSLCTGLCGNSETSSTTILNQNVADITNSLVVRGATGDNTLRSTGEGVITTGDAVAAANIVNVANTTFINSNYYLIVMNSLGDLGGDIILPNSNFFRSLLSPRAPRSENVAADGAKLTVSATSTNDAVVENNITVEADTGSNVASSTDASIETGNASAVANVQNIVNQNLFGGESVVLLFRVFGNWTGNIFNLPEGILWRQTANGIELMNDSEYEPLSPSSQSAEFTGDRSLLADNNSIGSIKNNIGVYALTGDNDIAGGTSANISTGDAVAAANVVNIVNTNVVGRNWMLAIVNIFGDWSGNISFGAPDLWLGSRTESSGGGEPGSNIRYIFTVTNRGDASASNVRIRSRFNNPRYVASVGNAEYTDDEVVLDLGEIAEGETREVYFDATVSGAIPIGSNNLETTSNVSSYETDADGTDNADVVSVILHNIERSVSGGGTYVEYTPRPILEIVKTNSATANVTASSTVDYKIVIKNSGGNAYHSVLKDIVKDEAGTIIHEEEWVLDEIFPNEEIVITYSVFFNDKTKGGVYSNVARVEAIGRHPSMNPFYGDFAYSNVASSSVTILGKVAEVVSLSADSGAETTVEYATTTPLYLSTIISKDDIIRNLLRYEQGVAEWNRINQSFYIADSPSNGTGGGELSQGELQGAAIYEEILSVEPHRNQLAAVGILFESVPWKWLWILLFLLVVAWFSTRAHERGFRGAFRSFFW